MSQKVQKLYYKRKCKAAQSSTERLIKSKVGVRSYRLQELERMQQNVPSVLPKGKLDVLAVNFAPEELSQLHGIDVVTQTIGEKSWQDAVSLFGSKYAVDVVFLKLQDVELQEVERSIIALCFMKSCPAIVLAKAGSNAAATARELTASTWPVFTDMEAALECLTTWAPRTLYLRNIVLADIEQKVERYKKVNPAKHFGTRAAVALIPCGVHAVNFAGMLRLVKRMMKATGMLVNKQVATTVGTQSAVASVKVAAIDEVGDVYQYIVAATILADMGSAFAANGLTAALATLDAVDMALLGSVSFVTGAVSTLGAYLTRPQLVGAISKFLANLQVTYLLNPDMRRDVSEETDEEDCSSSKISELGSDSKVNERGSDSEVNELGSDSMGNELGSDSKINELGSRGHDTDEPASSDSDVDEVSTPVQNAVSAAPAQLPVPLHRSFNVSPFLRNEHPCAISYQPLPPLASQASRQFARLESMRSI